MSVTTAVTAKVSSPIDRAHSNFSARRLKGNTIHRKYGETKAQYLWRLLRLFVRKRLDKVTKDELEDQTITHGVIRLKHLNVGSKIKSICLNIDEKQIVALDVDDYISFYKTDGRFISSQFSYDNSQDTTNKFAKFLLPIKPYERIVYCNKYKQFIGWKRGDREINLFSKTFELLSTAKSPDPIECLAYEPTSSDIITSTTNGDVTIWNFRYNAKYLIQKTTHRNCLDTKFTYNIMILEPGEPRMVRCYFATNISVVVLNAFDGKIISTKDDLHIRAITAITVYLPMKFIITASREGSIKVWDQNWTLKMVFVGHHDSVLSLAIHPFAPYVISSSMDKTIKIWSLDQQDIVDKIDVEEPIEVIITERKYQKFLCGSNDNILLWKIDHIYEMFTSIGRKISSIQQFEVPYLPRRTVVQCETGGLHIINPASGNVLTSLILEQKTKIIDSIYSINENVAIVCLDNGSLLKVDVTTNPCKIAYKNQMFPKKISKLLHYEYISDVIELPKMEGEEFKSDEFDVSTKQSKIYQMLKTKSARDLVNIKLKSFDRSILFAGCHDGSICVLRWDNLNLDYEIEMHNNREISQLVANVKEDQIISAGLDLVIKIWRVYPFVVECLSLLRTIFLPYQPKYCCLLRNRLCVAFNDMKTFAYTIVFFNRDNNDKYEHKAELDHSEPIVSICSSEKLKIVASAGLDGTVRLWNINNEFLRCVNLKEKPTAMSFSSERADILLSIGNHLFRMDHKSYLPKLIQFKMISMKFDELETEDPLPYNAELRNQLTTTSILRLDSAHKNQLRFVSAKTKSTTKADDASDSENGDTEMQMRNKGIAVLNERDMELRKLYRGEIVPVKRRIKKKVAEEGFNNYMKMYYDTTNPIRLRDPDFFEIDSEIHAIKEPIIKDRYGEYDLNTFFPRMSEAKTIKPHDILMDEYEENIRTNRIRLYGTATISKDGMISESEQTATQIRDASSKTDSDDLIQYLENESMKDEYNAISVVDQQDSISNMEERKTESTVSIPPIKFSESATASKSGMQLKAPYFIAGGFIPNSILIKILWSPEVLKRDYKKGQENPIPEAISEEEDELKYDVGEEVFRETEKNTVLDMIGGFYDRRLIKTRTPTPVHRTPTPIRPRHTNIEDMIKQQERLKEELEREILDRQLAARLAREAKEAEEKRQMEEILRRLEEERLREEEDARLRLIKESEAAERARLKALEPKMTILDTTWFKRYYTQEQLRELPKKTQSLVIDILKKAMDVLRDDKEVLEETTFMLKMLSELIKEDKTMPKERKNMEPIANNLVKLMRKLDLNIKDSKNQEFVLQCLSLTSELGDPVRNTVIEWMYWFIEGTEKLRRNIRQFFSLAGINELCLFFYEELDSWETWKIDEKANRREEIVKLCTDWLTQWTFSFETHIKDTVSNLKSGGSVEARISAKSKEMLTNSANKNDKKISEGMTVKFDRKRHRQLNHIVPIEVINYFCEMQHEAEKLKIEKMQIEKDERNTVLIVQTKKRNTILIRLGESNTEITRIKRNTDMILPPVKVPSKFKQGDIISATHINLPLKHVYPQPFQAYHETMDFDFLNEYNHIDRAFDLLTLRTAQKYFVLKNSYSIK